MISAVIILCIHTYLPYRLRYRANFGRIPGGPTLKPPHEAPGRGVFLMPPHLLHKNNWLVTPPSQHNRAIRSVGVKSLGDCLSNAATAAVAVIFSTPGKRNPSRIRVMPRGKVHIAIKHFYVNTLLCFQVVIAGKWMPRLPRSTLAEASALFGAQKAKIYTFKWCNNANCPWINSK